MLITILEICLASMILFLVLFMLPVIYEDKSAEGAAEARFLVGLALSAFLVLLVCLFYPKFAWFALIGVILIAWTTSPLWQKDLVA